MQTIVSRTFNEIRPGDSVRVQRTLQAGDFRAWSTAFGDAGDTGEDDQGAARIITEADNV